MIKKFSINKKSLVSEKSDFVQSIEKTLTTPECKLKHCYLAKPFFYAGSHIPRYSVSLLFDKNIPTHKKFLENLEKMAFKNGVESLGYETDEGLILIKFQGKDPVQTYIVEYGKKTPQQVELEHDLPEGFDSVVVFELNTYFNKKTQKNGFNFSPKKVTFYLDENTQESSEDKKEESGGNTKNSRNRPRAKVDGVRDSELQHGNKRSVGKQLRTRKNPPKV
jgi:hypothetical protein